ncbi:MAG: hypothetical protein CO105_08930 [Comamonadaceae bacterium CG_4_9_14_3_um_filter_60_33]|nr:MAG: hypothetical protein AUK51_08765 [Comamonadaceae bacterium CG2_30_59_20]PIY28020.1 MAG: hypothetical protein COZ09_12105 [Comamonadaceae bacterium CG_4_10_14_3_um_filter_60_42]PJB43450.1 MAG: hypothetical protein CO105_08930 [Comamonadaceae bacterium CG_4_9_14_3_um_filter_60_33]
MTSVAVSPKFQVVIPKDVRKQLNIQPGKHLNVSQLVQAAHAASTYKLAMADAIIWQCAQVHKARLYTQDVDLKGLPDVVYQAKSGKSP